VCAAAVSGLGDAGGWRMLSRSALALCASARLPGSSWLAGVIAYSLGCYLYVVRLLQGLFHRCPGWLASLSIRQDEVH
jgi:hypothetical protein